ncbi:hypothetical protein NSIN_20695 [Nitrosotalea sinensis]|jgi:hypothetical protein|uniref:Uncharacterized protein n=1 Tax=Nitrosotalea sinensis TaxID=1499975 RepID=A0A2H1EGM9_9ARCH|nr:hypothetical protein [Candidatus Nitrosotalea sinensis]SHO45548.1 hypothetical protein NSIN_20695 [Candidatus Nitrosotalea sinensis]
MSAFAKGERVRIVESRKRKSDVYVIKGIKKYSRGGTLYLLKLLSVDPVLRIYHETDKSLLERIC